MVSGHFAHVAVEALLLGRRLFSYHYKPGLIVTLDWLVTSTYCYKIFTQKTVTVHPLFRHLNINLKLSKLKFLSPVSSLLILCLVLVTWMRLLMYCCYQLPWTWGLKIPSPSLAIEGLSLYLWSNVTNTVAGFCKINIRFWKTCTGYFFTCPENDDGP